ncbi:MAG: hypothetical protein AAF647_07245 [Pseudomonadota bacterium]
MKLLAPLTALATLAFAAAPFVTAPFSGFREDQLPIPQLDPPIQPAGYAFAIWGVIYTWLVVSALFGVFARRDDAGWNAARPALIASLAIGAAWLWIANASAIWASVTIWMMLAFALIALRAAPQKDQGWLRLPIGLYAGWLSAASFVSLAVTLAGYGVFLDGAGWALVGLPAATLFALAMLSWTGTTLTYGIAVIWALIGVAANPSTTLILVLALGGAVLVALATLLPIWRGARRA